MKHELLSPAGSPEICRAVLAAGADAVYLGGEKYGARAFAQNFSEADILNVLDLAHLYGKKIFLTVNTLLKNPETGEALYYYLKPYYEHGLDAIIVQDFGVFQFARKYFPELPVHVSTQMSVTNVDGAKFLISQGASRIVTARELSLPEIRRIYDETGVEIESFVHGALCYCYSGQCLMSSLIGGRSGNRGRCAQPCRLPYQVVDEQGAVLRRKEKYPLSPKDLCALELIPQLCGAGIYSFKIEGRMKSLEYAAGVTQIYRKYLDLYEEDPENFAVNEKDMQDLLALGNRNGFTRGYYEMRNGREMMTLRDSSHSSERAAEVYSPGTLRRIPVKGRAVFRVGEEMRLTLWIRFVRRDLLKDRNAGSDLTAGAEDVNNDISENDEEAVSVIVAGECVLPAQNRPLTEDSVRERLSRTGDTSFELSSLEIEMDPNCFVPVGQQNELRRMAFCQLQREMLHSAQRTLPNIQMCSFKSGCKDMQGGADKTGRTEGEKNSSVFLNVQIVLPEQLQEALQYSFVDMVSLDFAPEEAVYLKNIQSYFSLLDEARQQIQNAGKQAAFCFPYVFRENTSAYFSGKEIMDILRRFDTVWVRSYDSLGFCLNEIGLKPGQISLDHNLYIYSDLAYQAFAGTLHFRRYTASFELNRKELAHMPNACAEFCLYGYTPMMISAQCVYKNYLHCMKNEPAGSGLYLSDRRDKNFLIIRNCKDCYNIIYNCQPLYLFHQAERVKEAGFGSYRISFVSEDTGQMRAVLRDYRRSFWKGEHLSAPVLESGFTTGHFRRGVD